MAGRLEKSKIIFFRIYIQQTWIPKPMLGGQQYALRCFEWLDGPNGTESFSQNLKLFFSWVNHSKAIVRNKIMYYKCGAPWTSYYPLYSLGSSGMDILWVINGIALETFVYI